MAIKTTVIPRKVFISVPWASQLDSRPGVVVDYRNRDEWELDFDDKKDVLLSWSPNHLEWNDREFGYYVFPDNSPRNGAVIRVASEEYEAENDSWLFALKADRFLDLFKAGLATERGETVEGGDRNARMSLWKPHKSVLVFTAPCGDQVALRTRDVESMVNAIEKELANGS